MMKTHMKLFVIGSFSTSFMLIIYWILIVHHKIAIFMLSRKNSNLSLHEMTIYKCNFNESIGIKVDEFCHTMKRHSERNGNRTLKTYSVSDSYGKFGVKDSLSCWEDSKFRETSEENGKFIQMYPYGDSNPYLQELGLSGRFREFSNTKIPVFVTAASSNHFLEVQAQIQNLHNVVFPNYVNLKFIFYDIGLSEIEKKMTVLNEYGFVFWMDASVRFRTGKLDNLFEMAVKDGVKIIEGDLGVGYRTDPVSFKFLGEEPCLFADKNEIQATFFLLYRTRFTFETIMRPWVSCALISGCMYFPGSQHRLHCFSQKGLGFCHRFDQSIMSIILWRLYHTNCGNNLITGNFIDVRRAHTARYFESLEKETNA